MGWSVPFSLEEFLVEGPLLAYSIEKLLNLAGCRQDDAASSKVLQAVLKAVMAAWDGGDLVNVDRH